MPIQTPQQRVNLPQPDGSLISLSVASVISGASYTPSKVVPQPVALGIWSPNKAADGWRDSWASGQQALTNVAPKIIHTFKPWDTAVAWSAWDQPWAADAARLGCTPLISWEARDIAGTTNQLAYSNAAVSRGDWDPTLITWLKSTNASTTPFLLRFFWEMNGQWYAWAAGTNGNTPGSFIDAWRHVARLVRQYAPNARIVWCAGTSGSGWLPLEDCYPGATYVDVLSLDFYNTSDLPGGWSGGWQEFSAIKPFYDRICALDANKPVLIAETGSVAQNGHDKAAWYTNIKSACQAMSRIRGVVAFDNLATPLDFQVSADPTVYAAWKSLCSDPSMQGHIIA